MHCPMCVHYDNYVKNGPIEVSLEIWQYLEKSFEMVLIAGTLDKVKVEKIKKQAQKAGYKVNICHDPDYVPNMLDSKIFNIRYVVYPDTIGFFDIQKKQYIKDLPINDLHC